MASRRELLLGLGSATLAGLSTDLGLSKPAQAAGGWGRGQHSGLPFWLGAHGEIAKFEQLMPAGRTVDVVNLWEHAGHYLEYAASDASGWARTLSHSRLASGRASAVQWSSSPFCSGNNFNVPNAWPSSSAAVTANTHLNCSRPPTYTGGESTADRIAKQRRVWQIAASGWLDPVWRAKFRTFKSGYFVKNNLRNIRIILRVAHELNTSTKWGDRGYRRSYGMLLLNSAGDYQLVQEGLRRYMAVFLDVFGNVQSDIAGDFAYPADQLWPYWNTGPGHKGTVDVRLTCPSNAKLVGPDYYNFWPALLTEADWNTQLYARTKSGSPFGLGAWLSWANSIGRPLCLGEVGLMSTSMTNSGGRPSEEGWDNPLFITKLLDFCKVNAGSIGFISYFNTDGVASTSLPGHMLSTWTGITTPSTSCQRNPPGEVNRCASRAFANWAAANS